MILSCCKITKYFHPTRFLGIFMLILELGLPLMGKLDTSNQDNMSWWKEKAGFLHELLTPVKKWSVTVLNLFQSLWYRLRLGGYTYTAI